MKQCTRCLKEKPDREFYAYTEADPHKTGGLHAACKRCEHDARAMHRRANPALTSAVAWKAKIKRLFGITPEQYTAMHTKQAGRCFICRRASPDGRRLHIDHDHARRCVRGLLCHDCNRGLGMFHDDPKQLTRAAYYLRNPPFPRIKSPFPYF